MSIKIKVMPRENLSGFRGREELECSVVSKGGRSNDVEGGSLVVQDIGTLGLWIALTSETSPIGERDRRYQGGRALDLGWTLG